MIVKWLVGLIKNKKKKERVKVEIEELKKAILEDPKFRDEILRELEYRTGRRDILKAGVLGLLGLSLGLGSSYAYNMSVGTNTVREVVSDYTGVKIPKPCTCIVAQDGTGDYDVSPGEDASEVIQKAIDEAHRKGGGEVRIREGNYIVKSAHLAFPSNICIKGVGEATFDIKWGGYYGKVGYALITNEDYAGNGNENIRIENIRFISDPSNWPNWEKGSRLFVLKNVKDVEIVDCYFSHHGSGGELHIWSDAGIVQSENIVIRNCKFIHNYSARGLGVGDAIYKIVAKHARVINCYVDGSYDTNEFRNYAQLGINVDGRVDMDILIEGCYIRRCNAGIWIEGPGTRDVKVIGCTVENVGGGISTSLSTKSKPNDGQCIIAFNKIRNTLHSGIDILGSTRVVVIGNIMEDVSKGGFGFGISLLGSSGCIVQGNIIRNVLNSVDGGIFVGGSNNIITGNKIEGCHYGIRIKSSRYYNVVINQATNNIISGNEINAIKVAVQELEGANNNQIINNNIIINGAIVRIGPNTVVKGNIGYRTENWLEVVVPAGLKSVSVSHGLARPPFKIIVTQKSGPFINYKAYYNPKIDKIVVEISSPQKSDVVFNVYVEA